MPEIYPNLIFESISIERESDTSIEVTPKSVQANPLENVLEALEEADTYKLPEYVDVIK